ncbi:hypothetical protein [Pseudomonas sp. UBA7530]|uniref:hypothetical protein n=1 Tax=Pseudomonas sp. UBA7530 TaxID=1947341 RepID=UPI0025F8BFEC|nr:hypothetical protein [Pseudomonas sp. UBA7530]
MQAKNSPFQVLVILTQEDIATFRMGKKPHNVIESDFATQAELDAYVSGFDVYDDAEVGLEELNVIGSKVTFNVIEGNSVIEHHCEEFSTPAEAEAVAADRKLTQ